MNKAMLIKGLELINTKNQSIEEKKQCKSLVLDYKKCLEDKEHEIKKLKSEIKQKDKKIQIYEENINKLPKIIKKIWMNQIM